MFEGLINAERYIDILKKTLVPFDNDPKHTSRRAAGKTPRPRRYCASVHIHDKCEITSQHPHFLQEFLQEYLQREVKLVTKGAPVRVQCFLNEQFKF